MKQSLSLRVSQHLALTPQLQQSIRLLQLSTLELNQEIEQLLDDNPFLEREIDEAGPEAGFEPVPERALDEAASQQEHGAEFEPEVEADVGLGDAFAADWAAGEGPDDEIGDASDWGGERAPAADDDSAEAADWAQGHASLADFLRRQALPLRLDPLDSAALNYLIGSLDDDGYLEDTLESLAAGLAQGSQEQAQQLLHHFTVALGLLQSMEPSGVGARDLGECLRLQLRDSHLRAADAQDESLWQLAEQLCRQPLELLARRDAKRLAQACGQSEARIRLALACLARLEPKPGRRFADVSRQVVVPDVLVLAVGSGTQPRFRVVLNPDVMPRLRVHDVYAQALRSHKGEGHQALQQRLQEARWFIKNIQQRFDTILRVSTAIVERQRNFLVHGELAMRPLVLREIADELGLHESTISRVTTAKYMATPQGTFELKYFFGSGLGTETGGSASSTAVRALIRQMVSAENPRKPLSDQQLSEMLKEQGIECARRTVAKYREALRIAPAQLRKAV